MRASSLTRSGCVLLASLSLLACASKGPQIKSSPPAGQFGGSAWNYAKATVTSDGTTLSVYLFSDASVPDCSTSSNSSGYLAFTVPAKVGVRELQLSLDFEDPDNQTVTFVTPPSSNDIATDGEINVSALSDSSVTLGLMANGSTGDSVNGTFTTALCPAP